jgi:hypothetical protein
VAGVELKELNFLLGSERLKMTQTESQHLRETGQINKSLFTLGEAPQVKF